MQGHAVHIFVDKIIQPAPEIQRVALAPAGALNAGGQAGDSRQLAFHRTQDLAGSDLGIRAGQAVAALGTAHAKHQPGLGQGGHDLLQIF